MWPDNRIARDAHYLYRYDRHGRLTEKTDLIPEGVIRTDDERTHRYHYDSQHAYSALFDHGLASKSDQRFASIRSTGNLTFSTAF
ncbi:rhs element [Escherichia coli IS25]|nr:rhs element [Escherichia coli IS25]